MSFQKLFLIVTRSLKLGLICEAKSSKTQFFEGKNDVVQIWSFLIIWFDLEIKFKASKTNKELHSSTKLIIIFPPIKQQRNQEYIVWQGPNMLKLFLQVYTPKSLASVCGNEDS